MKIITKGRLIQRGLGAAREWPTACLLESQVMPFFSDTHMGYSAGMMLPRPSTVSQSIISRVTQRYNARAEQRDVFESHRHHVFSVAYYMTGDEREAEAILQSTFIAVFEKEKAPTVAAVDEALLTQLKHRFSLDPVPAVTSEGEGLGNRNIRRTDLEEAVWQMPERERLCFLLRDVEGYDNERIAELLQTQEQEVQRTVFSARLRMRRLLQEQRVQREQAS
jgi:DNA-directed RNA polymerase specialized sigma24 family protein